MPRRSGGGGRSAPRAAPRPAPMRNAPAPAARAPAPAPATQGGGGGGGLLGSLGATMVQGAAFGGGSAMAHRAVDSLMGPRELQVNSVAETVAAPAMNNAAGGADACSIHNKAFQDCLNNFGSDISKCQFYLDMLSECRRNSGSMMGA